MKLVDLKTLSEAVSLSVSTLRKYRGQGMPHYNVGRKILVDPAEFEQWLADNFKVSDPPPASAVDQVVADVLGDLGVDRG